MAAKSTAKSKVKGASKEERLEEQRFEEQERGESQRLQEEQCQAGRKEIIGTQRGCEEQFRVDEAAAAIEGIGAGGRR